ncbi:bifunctional biotin--[acetyl-CoA-carboxylase] ligase/biotin operon repressor BirA [Shewanella maritima]|uniref:Bifunctional ligase/repressor BirA n=1 Tax=Shewanella maritima TaxID=2520507 RepID=A0A411PI01_9GAMM|nr:bifunctional biotin--[acetyl-CoA-carboxylase] ligase/biotin operon repressor BirA [Shewanella maritima]QBF83173.1 bifunctional biotin--[acetyl-CoA-carboxylase] ligase/biotin operon repressor BirA [Shewanella maritima]
MSNQHWSRKRQILQLLSAQRFVSGETIAKHIGLSRGAVNQHIDAMAEYGIDIYSVKGKGYQLASAVSLIDEAELIANIDKRCFYFDEIDSTNAFVMGHAAELASGDFCVAEYQSQGRGRRGRAWQSPYGHHLYTSLFWRSQLAPQQLMGLSLVVGCALVKVLQDFGVTELGLKWPNDIYLEGRKLAGVLVELGQNQTQGVELVIGIGLNMNMPATQGNQIDQPWSDLSHLDKSMSKTQLLIALHKQLTCDLREFEANGLASFIERWNQADLFMQKQVKLLMAPNEVHGVYHGIDNQGAVVLETEAGMKSFIGGEITLRSN